MLNCTKDKVGDWITRLHCYDFSAVGFPVLVWKKKNYLKCIYDTKFLFEVVRLWLPLEL